MPTNKSDEEEDQVTQVIGEFGKWQGLLIIPLGFHFLFGSWQTLATSFLAREPDFFCKVEAPIGVFDSLDQWRNFSNPIIQKDDKDVFDKCNIYDLDFSKLNQLSLQQGATPNQFLDDGANLTIKNCTEFEYDFSEIESSIVTDFNLVCSDNWKITLATSVYMFGIFCGAVSSGLISDKFGRKLTIIMFSNLLSVFSIATAFSSSMEVYIFLRWASAFSSVGFWTTFYVYAMEMVGKKWKTIFGIGFEYPWAIAYSLLPGIAYAERDWRNLQLILSVPPVIFLIIYFFIPESPRWLLSQGRIDEARVILEKACKMNGRHWPENLVLEGEKKDKVETTNTSILDLFKTPNLRKNTLISYFNWFTASFVYYALTFDSGTLIPGNIYINFAVSGLIEIPAYTICIPLLYYLGRRGPLAFMYYLLGGCLLISLASPNPHWILAMATLGKFGAICAFAIIYVQAVEIFPTVLRSSAIGSSSAMARVGSVLAPVIGRELAKVNRDLTIVIFSVVALLAGTFTLFLPESNNKKLPDTVEEGEAFGKGETAFDICKSKTHRGKAFTSTSSSNNENIGMQNQASCQ